MRSLMSAAMPTLTIKLATRNARSHGIQSLARMSGKTKHPGGFRHGQRPVAEQPVGNHSVAFARQDQNGSCAVRR